MASNPDELTQYVTAVLVTHDGATWITEVVAALTSQSRKIDRLIAIDTDSKDESAKKLRSAGITTLSMSRGTGFGDAIDEALRKLPSKNSETVTEWIWLIHDDSAPAKSALAELLTAIENRPTVAIAGPKIKGWHDRNHLLEIGVSIAGNGARWTGLEYREQDQGQRDGIKDELAVSTAGALIRRDVYEELGGLDPNLSLFRDDVDFGWRANVAGHAVISVSNAVIFHAEAAASERRSVDVSEAFLHRPLLLDRRNAAYVILANSSNWLLPILGLQLFASALARAIGYLFAKLPGYAADEIAAVGLLIIRPNLIFQARKNRKKTRLLSPRTIARFVPPRGSQLRLAIERSRAVITRFGESRKSAEELSELTLPTIDLGNEDAEEVDNSPQQFIKIRALLNRPIYPLTLLILILTLIASRNRFGSLAGGALSTAPASAFDLFKKYIDSWHPIGLGSSSSAPPWIFLLALSSIALLGNIKLFIALLFIFAVPLALIFIYRLARKITESRTIAFMAAMLYAFSPPVLGAVNTGSFGTLFVALIAPFFFTTLISRRDLRSHSWEKLAAFALFDTFILIFAPSAFLAIFFWQLTRSLPEIIKLLRAVKTRIEFYEVYKALIIKLTFLLLTPLVLTLPWSLNLIRNPSRFLLNPGIPVPGGSALSTLLTNPGGFTSLPFWIISPALAFAVVALFSAKSREYGELAVFMIGFALLTNVFLITGNGVSAYFHTWSGSILTLATLSAIFAGINLSDNHIPRLSRAHFNFRHILLFAISFLSVAYLTLTTSWWVSSGADSQVSASHLSRLPAFLSAGGQTDERYKTLVLYKEREVLNYFIARDASIELGDPDLTFSSSKIVDDSIKNLVNGSGVTSSKYLGEFGIKFVFMANPVDNEVVRTIDGIGGFTRLSATRDGISWKIGSAHNRISYISNSDGLVGMVSGAVGTQSTVPGAGTVVIGENFDSSWKLLLNGSVMKLLKNESGMPEFKVPSAGDVIIYHDGTSRRAWISLQAILAIFIIVLATPGRRRKREFADEELA